MTTTTFPLNPSSSAMAAWLSHNPISIQCEMCGASLTTSEVEAISSPAISMAICSPCSTRDQRWESESASEARADAAEDDPAPVGPSAPFTFSSLPSGALAVTASPAEVARMSENQPGYPGRHCRRAEWEVVYAILRRVERRIMRRNSLPALTALGFLRGAVRMRQSSPHTTARGMAAYNAGLSQGKAHRTLSLRFNPLTS